MCERKTTSQICVDRQQNFSILKAWKYDEISGTEQTENEASERQNNGRTASGKSFQNRNWEKQN